MRKSKPKRIKLKVGDCLFWHYIAVTDLKGIAEHARKTITKEERTREGFYLLDENGDYWCFFDQPEMLGWDKKTGESIYSEGPRGWVKCHGYGKGWEANDIKQLEKELNSMLSGKRGHGKYDLELYWMN